METQHRPERALLGGQYGSRANREPVAETTVETRVAGVTGGLKRWPTSLRTDCRMGSVGRCRASE